MADKKISDFTAATALAVGDFFEIETAGGNSRKVTAANVATELRRLAGAYVSHRVQSSETQATFNVNSTSYINTYSFASVIDLDEFPFTHFRITFHGQSNAAAQTVTAQLAVLNTPATPIHTGGDDVTLTNSFNSFTSGWLTRDAGPSTGQVVYTLALKGSNTTVDLQSALVVIEYKID